MDYKTIFFIIMNLVFFLYVGGITLKYGIQSSISQSYYILPRNMQWLFTIITWGYAFPAIIIAVEYSGLAFLAGAGISFVGASPAFRSLKMVNTVHMIGATTGVIASQLMILLSPFNMWYINVVFLLLCGLCYFIVKLKQNFTWWAEIIAFLTISVSYAIQLFIKG